MNKQFKLMLGDNMVSLKKLPDNSIDSIVTDPPYGLSFMGKKWDYDVPSVDFWKEVFRVLKPGGHILSFGGTRTYHRMVVNIEDAGFEIRDQIQWIYGSGFPKSHNIGKGVEKRNVGGIDNLKQIGLKQGIKCETGTQGYSYSKEYVAGKCMGGKQISGEIPVYEINNEWEGWGTGLKPANEPIVLARKPLSEKTIIDNVIKWGTGGINIDGCRISSSEKDLESMKRKCGINKSLTTDSVLKKNKLKNIIMDMKSVEIGRFPANVILDEEAGILLDEQSGQSKSNKPGHIRKGSSTFYSNYEKEEIGRQGYEDNGGASRFFYQAKVSKKERNLGLDGFEDKGYSINQKHNSKTLEERYNLKTKNNHPTLKPINLMTYLCRLITHPNGVILDPFMGSGSTGISALLEGFRFIGMEMDEGYYDIAERRIIEYEQYRSLLKK